MKISVIMVTYNSDKYISRAIRSLYDQSLSPTDYEIIVVDDHSTDDTEGILGFFGPRLRVIKLERQKGIPHACNEGIKAAIGQFVVRVDADDYVHKDFLKIEYLFLSLNKHMDAVACNYYEVNDKEEIIGRKSPRTDPIACGIMFRKDHLVDIGLYDEDFLLLEDMDLRIRYLKKHGIYNIELPLYRYRKHSSNITNNTELVEYWRNILADKHGNISK